MREKEKRHDLKYTGGYVEIIWKFYAILYEGLKHLQIWVSEGVSLVFPIDTEGKTVLS